MNVAESGQAAAEYMVKRNNGYGFRNDEKRFDCFEAMESFAKHIKS